MAEEAELTAAWKNYAQYCRLREHGLRKQAFVSLDAFTAEAPQWDFESRKAFVLWLCSKMDMIEDADYDEYVRKIGPV